MTTPVISLLLPTRGRVALVQRLFLSISKMTKCLNRIEVVLYIDKDDIESYSLDSTDFQVIKIIGPRLSMGGYNSACMANAHGDVLILANDDMVIRTPNWDDLILALDAEFEDRIYLGYANDLFKKKRFCTFPILSRHTCDLLVSPYPDEYRRSFIDVHLFDIFKRLQHTGFNRIRYIDELVFEHLHFRVGKAPYDETYGKGRIGRFSDDPTFIALINSRKNSADQLLSILNGSNSQVLYQYKPSEQENTPVSLVRAITTFTHDFLFDRGLPLRWRSYLWLWFIGRYMAGRGMLRPFVSGSSKHV